MRMYFVGLFICILISFYAIKYRQKFFFVVSICSEIRELKNWKIRNPLKSEPTYQFLRNSLLNTAEHYCLRKNVWSPN